METHQPAARNLQLSMQPRIQADVRSGHNVREPHARNYISRFKYIFQFRQFRRTARRVGHQLLHALIPGRCTLCLASTNRNIDLCIGCEEDLPWHGRVCRQCGLPIPVGDRCGTCIAKPPPFSTTRFSFLYQPPIPGLITRFKFGGDRVAGRVLSELLARQCEHLWSDDRPDVLVPVPLHRRRRRTRGFNQAELIAQSLSASTQIPVDPGLCRRIVDSPPQSGLTARERRSNLIRAFEASPRLRGRRIAIVDDVMTTGSTVSAVAREVARAGASNIEVVCIARTVHRKW